MLTPIANPVFYGILNDPFKEIVRKRFPWIFKKLSIKTILHFPRQSISLSLPVLPRTERQQLVDNENGFSIRLSRSECPMVVLSDENFIQNREDDIDGRENHHSDVLLSNNNKENNGEENVETKRKIFETDV